MELEERLARGIGENVRTERRVLASVIGGAPKHIASASRRPRRVDPCF